MVLTWGIEELTSKGGGPVVVESSWLSWRLCPELNHPRARDQSHAVANARRKRIEVMIAQNQRGNDSAPTTAERSPPRGRFLEHSALCQARVANWALENEGRSRGSFLPAKRAKSTRAN
jgi:hypothetical protein